jgi:hypothetical protein
LLDPGVVMVKTFLVPCGMIPPFLGPCAIDHRQSRLSPCRKCPRNVRRRGELNGEIDIACRFDGAIEIPEDEGPVFGT